MGCTNVKAHALCLKTLLELSDGGEPEGFVPALPPESTSLYEARAALRPHLTGPLKLAATPGLGEALAAGGEVDGLRTTFAELSAPRSR